MSQTREAIEDELQAYKVANPDWSSIEWKSNVVTSYNNRLAALVAQGGPAVAPAADGTLSDINTLLKFIELKRGGQFLGSAKSLANVYYMKNSPDGAKGFGFELHGQEDAGRMLANYVDEKYRLTQLTDTLVKEKLKQPVCVHGVGCGKSMLLSHGLYLHKKYCRNEDLSELLRTENHPLAIHISLNSGTSFSHEFEKNIHLAVARRILASCLGLSWGEAVALPLSDSLSLNHCLGAIIAYHKKVHGMGDHQKVFVYLGIDEINQLVQQGPDGKPDISSLKKLAKAMQSLFPINGFVSSLLAGTHFADMVASFLGSGIDPLNLELKRLSEETIESMLVNDARVSYKYIKFPVFQKLLQDIGPVMRAIGIAVSHLDYEFKEKSVLDAKAAVQTYLCSKMTPLNAVESRALLGLVLTGRTIALTDSVCKGSSITLDTLQNLGTIILIPSLNEARQYSVFMSRLMLDAFVNNENSRGYLADAAKRLLAFIDTNGPDSFDKFVAHFHNIKKAVYLETSPDGVPITSFFSGALIGRGLLKQELKLTPASVSLRFPDGVMRLQGNRYPETAESEDAVIHLQRGGVVLNAKGSAIDALVCEQIRDIDSPDWQDGVIVYAPKHTIVGGNKLSFKNVKDDYNKATKALLNSKNHSKALTITVHFSNRQLPKEMSDLSNKWMPEWERSIVIGHTNIESVVGPMFGRMLTSHSFYYGVRANKAKFSTLAQRPVSPFYKGLYWMGRLLM